MQGDESAEKELFEVLTARLRLFTLQRISDEEDANDIVQDALTKVLGHYKEIKIETSFAAWAYKVLTYEVLNHVKKKKRRGKVVESIGVDHDVAGTPAPNPELEPRLLDCLRKINRVNPRYARILNLSYQGYSVAEICRRMDISSTNLYTILSRSRGMLEKCLDKGGID